MPELRLRHLRPDDLDSMHALERAAYRVPWSRAMIASELSRPGGVRLGAFDGDKLIGQLVASRMARVLHIMNVSVRPEARRRGVGSLLLQRLFDQVGEDDDAGYTLEVRVSNVAAIALYHAHGFRVHGVRPGYYVDNQEDALVMWRPPQRVLESTAPGTEPDWDPSQ